VLVDEEMMHLALEIVGRALFSMDLAGEATRVGSAFNDAGERMSQLLGNPSSAVTLKMPFLPSTRRFKKSVDALDRVVQEIIDGRRAGQHRDDVLSWLIAARDAETGEAMDDRQLRDEVKTLMLAGYDTTADALIWTFHLLSAHHEVRARLEEEIDAVLAGHVPTVADLPRLVYTRMVIQEAMRLYPPIYMFARWGHQATDLGGYRLPDNAGILVCPYVIHRHPEFWPDPERFDPDRFDPENAASMDNYAYIPFGGGPRQCLGIHFTMLEAPLVLTTVMQNFRLDTVPGASVMPGTFTTFRPREGLPMLISRR
jgi:cytochrome P450